MAGSQIIPVDDIAHDDTQLEDKVKDLTGEVLTIESGDIQGSDFQEMDSDVGAVLVKKKGDHGAFRVTGGETQNVVTGPNESGVVIVVIKRGQTGMCLGRPSIRRFKR
ncbi:hypothetical protein L13192_10164 [Pyrenophora tritici-repentis]|nr:hypothetical protein Alg215_10285 [Pyrenophora tritici-repentis]KAI1665223.1 hypothetical protein L13192_10164 [Pyrenophora tritici-repentis]